MNDIDKRIAELSPAKRSLLEQRLKQKAVNANPHQTISPRANQQEAPLSFAQTRMWLLDQLEPGNPAYNRPTNIRLIGQLDVAVLEQSLNEIVRRHEVLRASFPAVDGNPTGAIAPTMTLSLPIVDISHLPNQDRLLEVQQLALLEAQRPFNLATGPLVRAICLRLGESEHILLLTLHHIIFDGWSMGVLLKELAVLYKAFSTGKPSTLSELPIQYADFAYWQRQHLQGEVLSQLAYWKTQLGGNLPTLELPTDKRRSPVQTFRGARQYLLLPKSLTQSLKVLSQRFGATLFMTLLAAFQILLYRYTGSDDIVVGSPIAGRNRTETEKLIGVFINTLVLRTYLDGKLSFREVLATVRKVVIDALAHQDIPFEKLVEELQPNRDLSHTPLFQVLFQLRVPNETVEVQGLRFEDFQFDRGIAAFDLTLDIVDTPAGLACRFEYNTDLFEAATIVRMAGHFQTMLEGIVANLEQPIAQLPILTAAEQHKLLVEWNNTQTDYPKDKCIHQLFEEQSNRTPDAVAVVYENQQLTYDELNCRANSLAHYLRSLGVGADVLVGICVERSLDMVVGLLGILKAGGAYVPLDPEYPTERLSFMLEDAQVSVLLTQQSLVERLPQHKAQLVCLDTDWQIISQFSQDNLITGVQASNLAYVIYTSGSTGQPKGVLVAHTGLLNLVFWHQRAFEITPLDKATQLAGTAFDAAAWELWPYLTAGASIYLVKSELLSEPQELRDYLILKKVTITFLPTPLAQELLSLEWTQSLAMRCILTGGDKLHQYPSDLVPLLVVNNYGPTENTVVTTSGLVVSHGRDHISPPIGRPIANTQIYILDSHLQPVPIGVVGELHIGGAGLARGYLNRPELTQEKFIPNPFYNSKFKIQNSKLYKTGDLARYLPDGNIEYLGRIDNQVKVRGFRIELGEIEAVLSQHSSIHSVVVTAIVDTSGDQRLVAYIVPQQQCTPTISELRQFLKTKLPEYMVPSAIVILEALPLTPNGKVDRHALPAPDLARKELAQTFVAPRNPIEEMLAPIWADVLRVDLVGIYDNFFELGGHSLQAAQLASKISVAINLDISVRLLFKHPTIAELALALGDIQKKLSPKLADSTSISNPVQTTSSEELPVSKSSPFFQLERRPLLSLLAAGKIAPVDSAAIGYFPNSLLSQTGLSRDEIVHNWYDNLPFVDRIMQTHWGRIARIGLPRFGSELYSDLQDTVDVVVEALEIAGRIGARTVSLVGLIPSATDYGYAIEKAIARRKDLPMISTGHATTSASVVLAIKRILHEGGRNLAGERVGFIGLGSVGISTLRLMLMCLPHPKEITLCDIYRKLDYLEKIRLELVSNLGFQGDVRVIVSQPEVPPEIYDATLIIGATNVPDILDLTRVKPGTMIVDDSAPHCFPSEQAVERFQEQEDILFTEGGVMRSPHPISQLKYLPRHAENYISAEVEALAKSNPHNITGCIFSSLLSSCFDHLKPTLGFVEGSTSVQHYELLVELGFQGADLHCENYVLAEESIRNFRRRFGKE